MNRYGRRRYKKIAIAFLAPSLALMIIFVVYPILGTIYLSFTCGHTLCLSNYGSILAERAPDLALVYPKGFGSAPPWGALIHNIIWIAIHVPAVVFLGLSLAYILRTTVGGWIIRSLIFMGMVVPMIVGGLIIRFMFEDPTGVIPKIFSMLGVQSLAKTWTNYPDTALFALILGSIWLWTGFSTTVYSAALETVPKDYIEAARIDGASGWQIFFHVIVPMLKPATTVVTLMTILWDLKIFDIVYVSTLGGPGGSSNVLALVMYRYFARALDYERAAATAAILTALTLIPGIILARRVIKGG